MPHRVLVVDDEEAVRSLLQDYLEGCGYAVTCAADGEEGIRAFRSANPHLVLVDFLLPKKNGFAVAEAIRRSDSNANTPIIMMSGVFKNPKTAVEAREKYRVVDFLSKPLDLERLGGLIVQSLRGIEPDNAATIFAQDPSPVALAPSAPPGPPPPPGPSHIPPRGLSYSRRDRVVSRAPSIARVVNGVFHGRPFPPLPSEGDVEQHPVALLISTIRHDGVTGMLDLTEKATHRRIYIVKGLPTFMQSNAEGENVGALLLRRGRVTDPDFQRCLKYMKEKSRTLQQSLLELRLANEHDLATAYKLLAGQLLPLAIGMASGRFKWRETDAFVGRVPEGNFEPMSVLFDGIRRHVHPPQILKFFKGREDVPLVKTVSFDAILPFFRRAFPANNIADEIDGKKTYRDIARALPSQAATIVPQLFGLVTSGMAVLPEVSDENAMDVAVNAAAAELAHMSEVVEVEAGPIGIDGGEGQDAVGGDERDLSPEERRARLFIERFHDEIMTKNFFEILGANPGPSASLEGIKVCYFDLAKKWHADAFAGTRLGPARRKVDEIFARITEAYETISDKSRREEYMVYLDRQARGLPTDVNQILRAEQLYDQSQAMIRRRDWSSAGPVLEEAIRLNSGEPLFYANLGWVIFHRDQRSPTAMIDAVNLIKRAIKEQENLPIAYQFLGQIHQIHGQGAEAKKWWQKCLEWEPNNIDAQRGLRMLNQREDKQQGNKSGLLSRFLTKK